MKWHEEMLNTAVKAHSGWASPSWLPDISFFCLLNSSEMLMFERSLFFYIPSGPLYTSSSSGVLLLLFSTRIYSKCLFDLRQEEERRDLSLKRFEGGWWYHELFGERKRGHIIIPSKTSSKSLKQGTKSSHPVYSKRGREERRKNKIWILKKKPEYDNARISSFIHSQSRVTFTQKE